VPVIEHIRLVGQTDAEILAQVNLENKYVKELLDLEIFDNRVITFADLVSVYFASVSVYSFLHAISIGCAFLLHGYPYQVNSWTALVVFFMYYLP
jgi:hypothetical protein